MAAVYTNGLNLFNLTTKSTPTTSDYFPLGDAAVTGIPLKQATIGSMPSGNTKITENVQNTNYNLVAGDKGKAILSNLSGYASPAYTYTLLAPGTAGAGWFCYIVNQNLSAFAYNTITPSSGFINGQSSIALLPGQSVLIFTDGTNYFTLGESGQNNLSSLTWIIAALPGMLGSTYSTTQVQTQASLLNSNVVAMPFIVYNNCQIAIAEINVSILAAASTATVGIYASRGDNIAPAASSLGTVSIATTSTGLQQTSFASPVQLYANNVYWAAIQTSTATTLSLGNVILNTLQQPTAFNNVSYGQSGTYVSTLSNSYSAGTLPAWSGTANNFVYYLPWIALYAG
jgi:hypothetical protein